MLKISIPGYKDLQIEHLVLDGSISSLSVSCSHLCIRRK